MSMRFKIILVILSALMASCSRDGNNFTVTFRGEELPEDPLYLARQTLAGPEVVDSALQDNSGSYALKGHADIPGFYILYFTPSQYINLIIEAGDHISVDGAGTGMDAEYFIEGSKDSRLIQQLVSRQAFTLRRITELSNEYEGSMGQPGFERIKERIDSTYDRIVDEHKQFSIDFIRQNPGSLASLMALYQQLGRNLSVFDYTADFEYYELVDSSLSMLYPNSEAVQDLNRRVVEIRKSRQVAPGAMAPDIMLPDTSGTIVPLSSLEGRYILLYFWASWAPESLEQNEILADVSSAYGDRLVNYQVSLDRTRDSWTKAIREYNLPGVQVCDLAYWDSPVVDTYLIDALPAAWLIDETGTIVDQGFATGEINQVLAKWMN